MGVLLGSVAIIPFGMSGGSMRLPFEIGSSMSRSACGGGDCGCGGSCGCGSQASDSLPLGSLDTYVVMEDFSTDDGDGESYMSVQALRSMRDHAEDLLSRVGHDSRLPDWVESKLTRAAQSLNDVYEYMSHGKGQRIAGLHAEIELFDRQYPFHKDLDLIASRSRTLVGGGTFDIPGRLADFLARSGLVNIIEGVYGKELKLTPKGRRSLRESSDAFADL